jgi:cytochrome P450
MLHTLQSENVTYRVQVEMEPSFEPNSIHFNLSNLCSGTLLNSVYRETLRLRQLGPVARVPRKPDYLLSGKWSILPRTPILAVSWLAGRDETFWNTGATLPNGRQEHPVEAFWAERFLTYPDDVTSGPIRKPNTYVTEGKTGLRSKERTPEDDKTAKLTIAGLQGHFFPFGGGAYRCPGENFARQLTMSTVALMLRMLDIVLVDPVAARGVQSYYAQYPLGDHRFDRKVPIRVRRRAL